MPTEKKQMIDWLRAKNACREGRKWAERECNSLAEVWTKARPDWLLWVASRALDKRERVAYAAACAERVRHLMADQRSRDALDVAHRYGRGEATAGELSVAYAAAAAAAADDAAAAYAAADDDDAAAAYAYAAADDAAAYAAAAAADAAAYAAADDAAGIPLVPGAGIPLVPGDAAYAAADAAAYAAASYDAERKWQAEHVRSNFRPDWSL